jgi:hypothetical protein
MTPNVLVFESGTAGAAPFPELELPEPPRVDLGPVGAFGGGPLYDGEPLYAIFECGVRSTS